MCNCVLVRVRVWPYRACESMQSVHVYWTVCVRVAELCTRVHSFTLCVCVCLRV